jgi:hypothetical protein
MARKVGQVDDMSQAVIDWLEKHHIRGKDVYAWSGAGQDGDISTMTISFYVSGVDEVDACPDTTALDTPSGQWVNDSPHMPADMDIRTDVTEQMTAVPPYNPDQPRPYIQRYLIGEDHP